MTNSDDQYKCWYCRMTYKPICFSCEFDTFVHHECAALQIQRHPDDTEAQIIWKEING